MNDLYQKMVTRYLHSITDRLTQTGYLKTVRAAVSRFINASQHQTLWNQFVSWFEDESEIFDVEELYTIRIVDSIETALVKCMLNVGNMTIREFLMVLALPNPEPGLWKLHYSFFYVVVAWVCDIYHVSLPSIHYQLTCRDSSKLDTGMLSEKLYQFNNYTILWELEHCLDVCSVERFGTLSANPKIILGNSYIAPLFSNYSKQIHEMIDFPLTTDISLMSSNIQPDYMLNDNKCETLTKPGYMLNDNDRGTLKRRIYQNYKNRVTHQELGYYIENNDIVAMACLLNAHIGQVVIASCDLVYPKTIVTQYLDRIMSTFVIPHTWINPGRHGPKDKTILPTILTFFSRIISKFDFMDVEPVCVEIVDLLFPSSQ